MDETGISDIPSIQLIYVSCDNSEEMFLSSRFVYGEIMNPQLEGDAKI